MAATPIKIEFAGIDRWGRPTFVSVEKCKYKDRYMCKEYEQYAYFCDTEKLFSYDATAAEVHAFYDEHPDKVKNIVYKGRSFGAEPEGDHLAIELVKTM